MYTGMLINLSLRTSPTPDPSGCSDCFRTFNNSLAWVEEDVVGEARTDVR